jgi:hypothetical protein
VLRASCWEDLDDLLELINSLLDKGAEIHRSEKASRDEEIDWSSGVPARLKRDKTFLLGAIVDGKVGTLSDSNRREAYEKHIGVIGIIVERGFRDLGMGRL